MMEGLGADGKSEREGGDSGKGNASSEVMAVGLALKRLHKLPLIPEADAHLGSSPCNEQSAISPPIESMWQP